MKKKKKCTKAISRGGIVRSLPPYARAMRFANRLPACTELDG